MNLPDVLSEREKEAAELLLQGKSNKQIAQALGISTRTAEFHISNIYAKLGVSSRAEAIVMLSETHLRESTGGPAGETTGTDTGAKLVEPAADLREATVDDERDPDENDEHQAAPGKKTGVSGRIRRITRNMNKVILTIVVILVLGCGALAFVGVAGLLLFNYSAPSGGVKTGPVTTVVVERPPELMATPTPVTPNQVTPSLVTPTPYQIPVTPGAAPEGSSQIAFQGVQFNLDESLAAGASGQIFAEQAASPDSPYWDVHPTYVRVTLDDYALAGSAQKPVVAVYPAADYRRLSPQAAQTLDALQAYLAQPETETAHLPFLPVVNAGQVFTSNVEIVHFQNGSGVRYLTVYAQYPAPVNNHDLFYTFQGLTADGQYAVSIVLPVNHASLPASPNALSQQEMEAIAQDPAYYSRMADALNSQPGSSFTPSLAKLDGLVQSLSITQ